MGELLVEKRNGERAPMDLEKIHKVVTWAAERAYGSQFLNNAQCSGKPLFFPVPVLTNFWPPRIFFVKTQRIRNKPSNFTNFLLYNQIILHKRGGNQSSGSTKSLHWLISFAACSLISG